MRRQTFLYLWPGKAEKLQSQRRVERGAHAPKPVVQRVFGPADRRLRALRQLRRDFDRFGIELGVLDREADQTDPFRFRTKNLLAQ